MKLGIAPRRSSSVCVFTAALVARKGAHPEDRQAQIDCCRIQCIDGFAQLHSEALHCIELSGLADQHLSEVGVDPPVAGFVRIGQRRTPNRFTKPHVIELRGLCRQAGFDVFEALPIGQLGKRHSPKMFGAAQRLDVTVAAIPLDNPRKCYPRQKIHQLGSQRQRCLFHVRRRGSS